MNYTKFKLQRAIRSFYRVFGSDEALHASTSFIDRLFEHGRITMELRQWAIRLTVSYHELLEV